MSLVTQTPLARSIDHTLLKPEATSAQIRQLCDEAVQLQVYSICIASRFVKQAKDYLKDSGVKVTAVVGFPLGHQASEIKAQETNYCIQQGADEIDMVLALGAAKEGRPEEVIKDIRCVVTAAQGKVVKVILETHLLTKDEKLLAIRATQTAGAHFVKTSTGFTGGGATLEEIHWLKSQVGSDLLIKASGGIRDRVTAEALLQAGADRLGTSQTVSILSGSSVIPGAY